MQIREVLPEDFDPVAVFLEKEFTDSSNSVSDWNRLFNKYWSQEHPLGYLIEDNHEIKGYLGLFYSRRILGERELVFCNMTTWVVHRNYRKYSLSLIGPLLKDPELVLTNLTPSKATAQLLSRLGFTKFSEQTWFFFPFSIRSARHISLFFNDEIPPLLTKQQLRIYDSHVQFKCQHICIKYHDDCCYIIMNKVKKKGLYFGYIHYISDIALFREIVYRISYRLCRQFGLIGLLVDDYLLEHTRPSMTVSIKLPEPRFYKSNSLKSTTMDVLFSELFVFNR